MSCSSARSCVWLAVLFAACAVDAGAPAHDAPDAAASFATAELIDLDAFQELAPDDDPFDSLVPGHVPCRTPAYVIEQDVTGVSTLEVRTDVCNYLSLAQTTRAAIRRGDRLKLLLWHNTLASLESAQAYAAIRIDGRIVWSLDVPIPSAAESYTPEWRADVDIPEGRSVVFHIHNHGANAWRLGGLTVETSH